MKERLICRRIKDKKGRKEEKVRILEKVRRLGMEGWKKDKGEE